MQDSSVSVVLDLYWRLQSDNDREAEVSFECAAENYVAAENSPGRRMVPSFIANKQSDSKAPRSSGKTFLAIACYLVELQRSKL